MSLRFPRRPFPPSEVDFIRGAAPKVALARNAKRQHRGTVEGVRRWREVWPPIPMHEADGRAFLWSIEEAFQRAVALELIPHAYRFSGGSVLQGAGGHIDGPDQTGTSLATRGWPAGGTFSSGDYLVVQGLNWPLGIAAPVTADAAGNVTFQIRGSDFIPEGQEPIDAGVVRLNGYLVANVDSAPEWPRVSARHRVYYHGLELGFRTIGTNATAELGQWDAVIHTSQVAEARSQPFHLLDGGLDSLRLPVTFANPFDAFGYYRHAIEPAPSNGWNWIKSYAGDSLSELWSNGLTDPDHFGLEGKPGLVAIGAIGTDGGAGADLKGPFRCYVSQYVVIRNVAHSREVRIVRDAGGVGGIPTARTVIQQNNSGSPQNLVIQTALGPADRVELYTIGGTLLDTLTPSTPGVWGGDRVDAFGDVLQLEFVGRLVDEPVIDLADTSRWRVRGHVIETSPGIWNAQAGFLAVYDALKPVPAMVTQCQILARGPGEARPGVAALVDPAAW